MRAIAGVVVGALLAVGIVACVKGTPTTPEWQRRQAKMNEITTLWAQIRGWRHEAKMDLDPSPATELQWRDKPVREAAKSCPAGHQVPKSCDDVCSLADAICDNAEAICGIADDIAKELGKKDELAEEKCSSAKASCREGKQRCCDCSEEPAAEPATPPPEVAP